MGNHRGYQQYNMSVLGHHTQLVGRCHRLLLYNQDLHHTLRKGHHHQSRQDDMSEMMMTGLRLTCEGVSPQTFREKFGRELKDTYMVEIDELVNLGLLEWACDEQKYTGASNSESDESAAPEILRLTTRGRLLGNQVFVRFV